MGSFYGSTQVRTDDRDHIRRLANGIAAERGIKCLIGPALGGWVGVYSEMNGQDHTVGEAIAAETDDDVLHLLVHDSDVMAYYLWRGGELVDTYVSRPSYFGDEESGEQEAMVGSPELLGDLDAEKLWALRKVLQRDIDRPNVFEEERLHEFAELLGIPNALTAYEYLKQGETDDVKGWEAFEELPASLLAQEEAVRSEQENERCELAGRLAASGLLLYDEIVERSMQPKVASAGDGFIAFRRDPGAADSPKAKVKSMPPPEGVVEFHRSPWHGAMRVPVNLSPQINCIASDSAATLLAATVGNRTVVLDTRTWGTVCEVQEEDWAIDVALSSDGRLLAHSSRREIVLTDVENGERIGSVPIACERGLVFHPSGRWLLAILPRWTIAIVEIDSREGLRHRELCVRGAIREPEKEDPNLSAFGSQLRRDLEKAKKDIEQWTESSEGKTTGADVSQFREQMKNAFAEFAADQTGASGRGPKENPMSLMFTRDGQWLCCGTDKGFRAYNWDAVALADQDCPVPVRTYDMTYTPEYVWGPTSAYVYSIVEDTEDGHVLFAGISGEVVRMDLQSGDTQVILTDSENRVFHQMKLSRDGQALSITAVPQAATEVAAPQDCRYRWSIWDYRKLIESGWVSG